MKYANSNVRKSHFKWSFTMHGDYFIYELFNGQNEQSYVHAKHKIIHALERLGISKL